MQGPLSARSRLGPFGRTGHKPVMFRMVTFDVIDGRLLQGTLSAVVISLVPMLRPFQWQSVLLPVRKLTLNP